MRRREDHWLYNANLAAKWNAIVDVFMKIRCAYIHRKTLNAFAGAALEISW